MEGTTFLLDVKNTQKLNWVVYGLYDGKGMPQFFGCCPFKLIQSVPDARKHNMFSTIFPGDKLVLTKIHKMVENKTQGNVWINNHIRTLPARPFMMQYASTYCNKVRVHCITTGEEFTSITECAREHGVTQSALSNHCAGNPSYATVGGRTYEYLT